ncbi:MAG TPA: glycosyltransferase [Gemmataceae bacterium]|nr:glycosyltransferase [Gemmataceae bacterium]
MDDAAPTILRLASPDWDAEAAARRIAQLETALMRRGELLEQKQAQLEALQSSGAWRAVRWYYKIRERLLPLHSRRRRVVRTAMGLAARSARSAVRRLTGRDLAQPDAGGEGDRVALDMLQYARWIKTHEPSTADLARQTRTRFPRRPTISIVVPVYNTPTRFLDEMIRSVQSQTYSGWELCIADGHSTAEGIRPMLEQYAASDPRIRVTFLTENRGIAGNTNAALELATGEFVALLDHDDTLAPFALHKVVRTINERPDADVIYSDEDKLDEVGRRVDPCFKPDWSPDTLRGHNYVCHLFVLRRELMTRLGGVRPGFDGAQDYDLVLRASEHAKAIVHIPQVLYHWRMHPQSTAANTDSKRYIIDAGRRALAEHLDRMRTPASVVEGALPGTYRVIYHLPKQPLVSILIPNRDSVQMLGRCLDSIASSSYANYEVIVLENFSEQPETLAYYRQIGRRSNVRIVPWTKPFNYAAINNFGAAHARGEVLLFLNNDVEAINPDWLETLVKHALRPEVGAVGAKLLYADGTIQHAGIVVGMGGIAGHVHRQFPRDADGYMQRLRLTHNCAAVTGACLMTRRAVFEQVGGFDEAFVLAFNDVDLCLQIQSAGYRVLWTPEAELYHLESKTRGYEDTTEKLARFSREYRLFVAKWERHLRGGDPYYNPNFRLDRADYALRA